MRVLGPVGQDYLQLQFMKRISPREAEILLLTHGEVGLYWIERRHTRNRSASRADQIADLYSRPAGDTIDQGGQPGEAEINLCSFQRSLRRFDAGLSSLNLCLRSLNLSFRRGHLCFISQIGLA